MEFSSWVRGGRGFPPARPPSHFLERKWERRRKGRGGTIDVRTAGGPVFSSTSSSSRKRRKRRMRNRTVREREDHMSPGLDARRKADCISGNRGPPAPGNAVILAAFPYVDDTKAKYAW